MAKYLGAYFHSPSFITTSAAAASLAVTESLKPMLELLEARSEIRLSLAVSGFTAELFSPECTDRIAALVRRGTLEILFNPFFDPEASLLTEQMFTAQLEACERFWTALNIQPVSCYWLPPQSLNDVQVTRLCTAATPTALVLLLKGPQHATVLRLGAADGVPVIPAAVEAGGYGFHTVVLPCKSSFAQSLTTESLETFCRALQELPNSMTITEAAVDAAAAVAQVLPLEAFPSSPVWAGEYAPQLSVRLAELVQEWSFLPSYIEEHAHLFANRERFTRATTHILKAFYRPAEVWCSPREAQQLRRFLFRSMISAQVEIDAIRNPDVEPAEGWITYQSSNVSRPYDCIDTTFLRAYFDPAEGMLRQLEYKPRKLSLLAVDPAEAQVGCSLILLAEPNEPSSSYRTEYRSQLLRKSRDLVSYRAVEPIVDRGGTVHGAAIKIFTFKAGIGAHLPNSTTGFSLEYWLDGGTGGPDTEYALELALALPSAAAEVASGRLLHAVGGVSEDVLPLSEAHTIEGSVPGGIHGVRLIDGLEHFILELRSAKPLTRLEIEPLLMPRDEELLPLGGVKLRFVHKATALQLDRSANTLFVSIP